MPSSDAQVHLETGKQLAELKADSPEIDIQDDNTLPEIF